MGIIIYIALLYTRYYYVHCVVSTNGGNTRYFETLIIYSSCVCKCKHIAFININNSILTTKSCFVCTNVSVVGALGYVRLASRLYKECGYELCFALKEKVCLNVRKMHSNSLTSGKIFAETLK